MLLPDWLKSSRQQLDPTGALSASGGAPPSGTTLAFAMERQLQTQWCWAAVAVSVSRFYNPGSTWSQCDVVNSELSLSTCCVDGSTAKCNRDWYLDRALSRTGNLNAMSSGSKSYKDLNTEVENGHPLGCRVRWSGGGAHFVVLHGYLNKTSDAGVENWVDVADPWYGAASMPYDDFRLRYQQNTGTWSHSYTTS